MKPGSVPQDDNALLVEEWDAIPQQYETSMRRGCQATDPYRQILCVLHLFMGKRTSNSCVANQKHRPFIIVFCVSCQCQNNVKETRLAIWWRCLQAEPLLSDFICLNMVKEVALLMYFTFTQLPMQSDDFSSLDVCINVTSGGY